MGTTILSIAATMAIDETKDLFSLFGTIKGTKTGESTYGPWIAMVGEFEAIRHTDGETLRAPVCHIQDPLETYVKMALANNVNEETGEMAPVEFAVKVALRRSKPKDENEGVKYEYVLSPLIEPKESDTLAALRNSIIGSLPAPETPSEEEPAPSDAPKPKAKSKK